MMDLDQVQYSTLPESNLYRSSKADVIAMTKMPEAKQIIPKAKTFSGPNLSISIPKPNVTTPQIIAWTPIAKEKNSGTMEVLCTLPIKDYELVIGKYLSAIALIFIGLLFTNIHFFT